MEEQDEKLEGELGLDMNQESSSAIYPNAEVRVEKAQYSILHVKRLCQNRNELIISPDFQRNKTWKDKQSSRLVESILMGIPIPVIYLFETKDGKKQVIDGRQRITAILNFLNGKLRLKDLKILIGLNGKTFDELETKLQGVFEDYQLFFYIIQPPTPERVKYDIFDRVNQGGTRLNSQEIRHALYRGAATGLIDDICGSDEFKEATGHSVSPKRMRDKYIVLRAIAFYYLFIGDLQMADSGMPIEYKSDMDDFLAKVMMFINHRKDPGELERLKKAFLAGLGKIYRIAGKDAFRFESAGKRRPINMPLFECLIYLFLFEWEPESQEETRIKIRNIKSQFDKSGCFKGNVDSTTTVNYRYSAINNLLIGLQQ